MLTISPNAARKLHAGSDNPTQGLEFISLFRVLRRQKSVLIATVLLFFIGGLLYAFTATPLFTSTALLLIDTRKVQGLSQQLGSSEPSIDTSTVDSQVEVIASDNVILAVINDLRLLSDSEFMSPPRGLVATMLSAVGSLFGGGALQSEEEKTRSAVAIVKQNLRVRRVALTYVLEISYKSPNASKSAQIANAIADAYITDQLQAKYTATKRASAWLSDRIAELREEANSAARIVQNYKSANNIVDTNRGSMLDQQLAEVNSQLTLSRAQTAEAKARLERIGEIMTGDAPEATVTDALKNDVVSRLRTQLLETTKRADEWSRRYGAGHIAVLNQRSEIAQLRRSLLDELNRIAETYKSEYEIAKVREDSVQRSLDELVQKNALSGQAGVKLRELESSAQTYRALYENFLQRYTEAIQQQTFPNTEARVITPATRPFRKSDPPTTLILALSLIGGVAGAVGLAMFRDNFDRALRSAQDVEAQTGLQCLTSLPLLTGSSYKASSSALLNSQGRVVEPLELLKSVVEQPFSRFSEGVRSIKVSIDLARISGPAKTIGLISSMPSEGKTTIASNLAFLIAQTDQKCLLIDADLRNPSVSRQLAPKASAGLIEVLAKSSSLQDALVHIGKLDLLPTVISAPVANTNEFLSSEEMRRLLATVSETYDYIILDLPPLAPVVDVRAISPFIDRLVLAAEWGRTRADVVHDSIRQLGMRAEEKILGVVLNKVNLKLLRGYEYGSESYYRSNYYERDGRP